MTFIDKPEEQTVENVVFQALGAASSCWENLRGAGIFESDRAKAIGEELMAGLERKGIDPKEMWTT